MIKYLFLGIFMLLAVAQVFAQKAEIRRKMTFTQFLKEATECKENIYQLNNADIQITSKDVYRFSLTYIARLSNEQENKKNNLLDNFVDSLPVIAFPKPINLYQVNFLNDLNPHNSGIVFVKCIFEKDIAFYDCNVNSFIFTSCRFKGSVLFLNEKEHKNKIGLIQLGTNSPKWGNCTFENEFRTEIANNQTDINFINCKSTDMIDLNYSGGSGRVGELGDISFFKCNFSYTKKVKRTVRLLGIWATEAKRIMVDSCVFQACQNSNHGLFLTGRYKGISLKNNILDVNLHTYRLTIEDDFIVENNKFNRKFSPSDGESLKFDLYSTNISWDQIAGKLTTDKTIFDEVKGDSTLIYEAQTDAELANNADYKRLLALYSRFYTLYKNRSEMGSANACRVEIKNIETRKSAYDYRQNHTLKTYLDWKMNTFLHDFSDYGTDYVKSMIYAFQVIAFFAIFYFFFPSQEDNLSKNRFMNFFNKAIEYFKTDKQLTEFQQERKEEEIRKIVQFKQNLTDSQQQIPKIVFWLGKPFYESVFAYNRFVIWLLQSSDFLKGKWSDLRKSQKIVLSFWVSIYFLAFVFTGLFMRIINAIAMSLNFFTTLGYGEIQAQGISKYLAVVEGAIGWFLLTVFSASLVSQLLQ